MGNVWQGVPLVTMQAFDFPKFVGLIQEHKCTRTHIVPPIALGLAKLPFVDDFDLSSCRNAMCAAAPLTTDVQKAVAERLGMSVKQGWGMSELSPLGTVELDDHPNRPGSVGPPCADTAVKVNFGFVGVADVRPTSSLSQLVRRSSTLKPAMHCQSVKKVNFASRDRRFAAVCSEPWDVFFYSDHVSVPSYRS
mgnify:FL=1